MLWDMFNIQKNQSIPFSLYEWNATHKSISWLKLHRPYWCSSTLNCHIWALGHTNFHIPTSILMMRFKMWAMLISTHAKYLVWNQCQTHYLFMKEIDVGDYLSLYCFCQTTWCKVLAESLLEDIGEEHGSWFHLD